ncbi:unnamed protein product [Gordionus sp. m RMFG-2023]
MLQGMCPRVCVCDGHINNQNNPVNNNYTKAICQVSTAHEPIYTLFDEYLSEELTHLRLVASEMDIIAKKRIIFNDSCSNDYSTNQSNHNVTSPEPIPIYDILPRLRALNQLNLVNNNIKSMKNWKDIWKIIPHLKTLNISFNKIVALYPESFTNSLLLETLDVSYNGLKEINPNLWVLPFLITLNVSNNNIFYLNRDSFVNIPNLRTIVISHNKITRIDYPMFDKVLNLPIKYISNNFLQNSQVRNIYDLNLQGNKISRICQTAFRNLNISGTLDLSENNLFSSNIVSLQEISFVNTIKISSNPIETITPFSFDSINVINLHIKHMKKLKFLDSLAFNNLHLLQRLKLSHNRHLKYISSESFNKMPNLEDLDLSKNSLENINQNMISHLPSLGLLDIRFNPIICDCNINWIYKLLVKRDMIVLIKENDSIANCLPNISFLSNNFGIVTPTLNVFKFNYNQSLHLQNRTISMANYTYNLSLFKDNSPNFKGKYVYESIEEPIIPYIPVLSNNFKHVFKKCKSKIFHEYLRPQLTVNLGDKLAIPCKANGHPKLIVHWIFSNSTVVPILDNHAKYEHPNNIKNYLFYFLSNNMEYSKFSIDGTLFLKVTNVNDTGLYKCEAKNSKSKNTYSINVKLDRQHLKLIPLQVASNFIKISFGTRELSNVNHSKSSENEEKSIRVFHPDKNFFVNYYDNYISSLKIYEKNLIKFDKEYQSDDLPYFWDNLVIIYRPVEYNSRVFAKTERFIENRFYKKKFHKFSKDLTVDMLKPDVLYMMCLAYDVANKKILKRFAPNYLGASENFIYHEIKQDSSIIDNRSTIIDCINLRTQSYMSKFTTDTVGINKRYTLIICISFCITFFLTSFIYICFKKMYKNFRLKRLALKSEKLSQQLFLDNMDFDDKVNEKISEEIRLTFENPAISSGFMSVNQNKVIDSNMNEKIN